MSYATLTSKYQITVPADLRDDLGLSRGDKLVFTKGTDGIYRVERAARMASLRGVLKGSVQLSEDELQKAIDEARHARAEELAARLTP